MWMPTEHEKYGVGESPAANSQPAPAAAGAHPASSPPPGTPHPGAAAGSGVGGAGVSPRVAPSARGSARPAGRPCGLRLRSSGWPPGVRVSSWKRGATACLAFLPLPRLRAAAASQGRGAQPRPRRESTPKRKAGADLPPARVGIAGVRSGAPRSRPLWRTGPAGASLPPAVPVLGRAGRVGAPVHCNVCAALPSALPRGTGPAAAFSLRATLGPRRARRGCGRRAVERRWGGGADSPRLPGEDTAGGTGCPRPRRGERKAPGSARRSGQRRTTKDINVDG